MHPVSDIRGVKGNGLEGRKIILCITGSIAAVECVKLARELARYGADVHAVMTDKAMEIVGPYSLEFATGNPVVTHLTGMVEHVSHCGDVPGRADIILVAPCTANTIGKMASGIDDTPVTTYLTTGIGTGIPVLVVPAMHETMYEHPVVQENIEKIMRMGVGFVQPLLEENKAKMASIPEIVNCVIRKLSESPLSGKKVLVITGATREPVDDMRYLSNRASGKTGIHLAVESYQKGADVFMLKGENVIDVPEFIANETFSSTANLLGRIELLSNDHGVFDLVFFVAGISDYSPEIAKGKISSAKKDLKIEMKRTPKVIERFRKLYPESFLVGFKAESVGDEKDLMKRAFKRLDEVKMNLIVANDLSNVSDDSNTILTITPEKEVFRAQGMKSELAAFIIEKCIELIKAE